MPSRVLIISPNLEFRTFLEQALEEASPSIELQTLDRYPKADEIQEIVAVERLTAVIIGFSDANAALSALRQFHSASAGLPLVAAHHAHDPRMALEAERAGALGSFAPPIDVERFRSMVLGAAPAKQSNRPGAVFAFVPARGGDGGSTVALHLAQALTHSQGPGRETTPTLFIDFDFHAGVTAFRLKLGPGRTVLDALQLGSRLEAHWRGLPLRWKGLDLLVPPDSYPKPDPGLFHGIPDFLEFVRRSYRFIVIDLPPALYASSRDVLRLSDFVFVVHTPEVVSVAHAARRVDEILALGLSPSRVHSIVNRADSKTPRSVDSAFPAHALRQFASLRNDYAALQTAERAGRLVEDGSRFAEDVRKLARQIVATV